MIVLDTSGIIAAYNRKDAQHHACYAILSQGDESLVITPLVLAEVDYLATKYLGPVPALTVLAELEQFTTVAPFVNDDLRQATVLLDRYLDMKIGLTDAANVVIAGRYKTTRLLTLDGHYRAIRPLSGDGFTALPG